MDRRTFLSLAGVWAGCPPVFGALPSRLVSHDRQIGALVVVELDGGNDGLNTVIPLDDPRYRELRPTLAIATRDALPIDRRTGLHPSLNALMPAWRAGQLAIVQGVGYAMPNRSHFRSQQIWRTASRADEYRADDTTKVFRLTLHGFDTHANQATRHAALLNQLASGLASLRAALTRSGDWNRTLVLTVSEFGRSARENASGGTEHGAAAPHFLLGGSVLGGMYGEWPRLDALDDDGALPAAIDFRRLYATALASCAGIESACAPHVEPLPILRS
ncbi:DUF1501 domain-containing protein [Candidatus Burkholderia verschuerenii]|uniref:DUF1501 domain-containing protein n=1 Tax=Candidatus Burkholderia verschuerenii TaxID=242163 RepID=UPI00067D86E7|nr:DUF1501 domain-containing protein [Candidatus Burkholderia verschuerenii]